jgi:glycosyltransferase involved in cell wall biosynthesis
MRVVHILRKYDPSEWGGTETAVYLLTTDMAKHGVESVVFAPRIGEDRKSSDPFGLSGSPVRRFSAHASVWGVSADRKRQMVAVGGNMVSFELFGALWAERNVDVVHSHAQGRLGAIARFIARRKGLPFVISIHGGAYDIPARVREELKKPSAGGWDWGRPLGLLLGARRLVDQADAVIAFNQREADLIRERHPGRRVLVESHGVPTALFARESRQAARNAYPQLQGRPMLLVLGRIDPTKNQEWVIAETAELVRRHPGILVVFVGAFTNQEYGNALLARIDREGLKDAVMLPGSLPFGDPRLIGLLQLARAVVLPSLSETFGIVILESWAAGTPVISSRTSGASALVEDGVHGLLFDLNRPEDFHIAVDRVLAEPELAKGWGAAGRAKAVAEFDTSVRAERMRRLYGELIEEKNALRHNKGR